ncbi:hypothetical protein AUQ44_20260 [Vibrio cidicii]|uniref:Uncharacterized protein n=1 Tax=Vibrio cidicii TaxID=1763883 RepID=A0A151JEM6_9VIBR|nr:hypothetical protein AUQ44_20260 [Vibrio cidicii]
METVLTGLNEALGKSMFGNGMRTSPIAISPTSLMPRAVVENTVILIQMVPPMYWIGIVIRLNGQRRKLIFLSIKRWWFQEIFVSVSNIMNRCLL